MGCVIGTGVLACTLDSTGFRAGEPPLSIEPGPGGQGGTGGKDGAGGTGGMGGSGGAELPAVCGDGVLAQEEACDDGNDSPGDGCTNCAVDIGYACGGEPSVCMPKPPIIAQTTGAVDINDTANHYNGTIPSMDCLAIIVPDTGEPQLIQNIELTVSIYHDWLGDLILKLVTPNNIPLTLMLKPGANEGFDGYAETPDGDTSDLRPEYPITFKDTAAISAENMGNTIGPGSIVCKDDSRCEYAPAPGKGPGKNFSDFYGLSAAGTWSLCAADGDNGDAGTLSFGEIKIWLQ